MGERRRESGAGEREREREKRELLVGSDLEFGLSDDVVY